jgi:hypothetical protein
MYGCDLVISAMDPFTIVSFVGGGVSFLLSISDRLFGKRITQSKDVILSFTELQAEQVFQIQSEIINLLTERPSHRPTFETPTLESDTSLHNRLGEALRRYGRARSFF